MKIMIYKSSRYIVENLSEKIIAIMSIKISKIMKQSRRKTEIKRRIVKKVKLREYWPLWLDKITRKSWSKRNLRHLLQNNFALSRWNAHEQIFVAKSRTTLYYIQQFFATCNNLICATSQVWFNSFWSNVANCCPFYRNFGWYEPSLWISRHIQKFRSVII